MYIILFIVIIIIYLFIPNEKFNNILNNCVKKIDKTQIKVVNNKWKDDFENRREITLSKELGKITP